ncbi:hypothetical protein BN940_09246 [Castellaniella defragrans 65Phen]|uniref:Uncharacterized protein n=1 Tax=Castellaniella defragrans (strain DSM 12143 / CCUG 39792 / 65Phen) TaxID=1437824 RepID=W8X970_CASD6|nr:hypothetical protein BN940_09246 [Castellaniella defragrans 65Phen]
MPRIWARARARAQARARARVRTIRRARIDGTSYDPNRHRAAQNRSLAAGACHRMSHGSTTTLR